MKFTAKQIAEFLNGTVEGDENATAHTFAKIEEGTQGALSFLSNPKYNHYLYNTEASIVLVAKDFKPEQPVKATLVRVNDPYESLAKLMSLYTSIGVSAITKLSYSELVCISTRVISSHFSQLCSHMKNEVSWSSGYSTDSRMALLRSKKVADELIWISLKKSSTSSDTKMNL
jgi:hypothetical protein